MSNRPHVAKGHDGLSTAWLAPNWRRQPYVTRGVLNTPLREQLSRERFFQWCALTTDTIRLFLRTGLNGRGPARSVEVANAKEAADIFSLCKARSEPITLLLNHAEKVEPLILALRAGLEVPYSYRQDDVVATLSARHSGIGYHAGHEDGFILQLQGSRRWRIWSSELTPLKQRAGLLQPHTVQVGPMTRPSEPPLIDCRLNAGDALYIPPFFPHEGVTLSESVSLSVAWRGFAVGQVVDAMKLSRSLPTKFEIPLEASCRLLPDGSTLSNVRRAWETVALDALRQHGARDADRSAVRAAIRLLLPSPAHIARKDVVPQHQ